MFESAAELARECNLDPSTIRKYIREGAIRPERKHKKKKRYKLPETALKEIKKDKPYPKYQKKYSDTEIYIILNNLGKPAEYVANLIKRNANSVKIKKCRLRKLGYRI